MSMPQKQPNFDYHLITALVMLLIFATPFTDWWSQAKSAWYLPYLFWLMLILVTAWIHWRTRSK